MRPINLICPVMFRVWADLGKRGWISSGNFPRFTFDEPEDGLTVTANTLQCSRCFQ
jgi:hypothetical protein